MEEILNNAISPQERQEFEEFKRQKRVAEARLSIGRLELLFTGVCFERSQLRRAVKEAEKLGIGGVCLSPYLVRPCADFLGKAPRMAIVACISQWGGTDTTDLKVRAIKRAVRDGATVAEVTAPVPAIKEAAWGYVKRELKKLRSAAKKIPLRINLEAPLLTREELSKLCELCCECSVPCVCTSGGTFGSGADEEDIGVIKLALRDRAAIKAEGADTPAHAETLCALGASIVATPNAVAVAQHILSAAEGNMHRQSSSIT